MPCVAGRIRIGMSKDNVNHPSHYEAGPFECIELTRLYPFAGGNAIKYVFRHRAKNGVEDLEKALWYLDHATADELRPMPCASNSKACHLLRVLERADWQVMAPFRKRNVGAGPRIRFGAHPRPPRRRPASQAA